MQAFAFNSVNICSLFLLNKKKGFTESETKTTLLFIDNFSAKAERCKLNHALKTETLTVVFILRGSWFSKKNIHIVIS